VATEALLERFLAAPLNPGQEKLCLPTHFGLAGTLRLAVERVRSSIESFQVSDRRGAGGKCQSLFLDIRIKERRHSSVKP
jgi:hypothetical protein